MENGYEGFMASNTVIISIDSYENEELGGRLYHFYMEEGEENRFSSLVQMIKMMEHFFDTIKRPMRSMEERYFVSKREEELQQEQEERPLHRQEAENMAIKSGDKATFVVHVCYRQNASWQGTVLWAEEKKKVNFRSALELIKLMDSALSETDSVEDKKTQEENRVSFTTSEQDSRQDEITV